MKTIKIISILVLSLLLIKCKSDDDNNMPVELGYFPVEVHLYDHLDQDRYAYFEYDNQNRLTQFRTSTLFEMNISYGTNGISQITDSEGYTYNFNYTEGVVGSIEIINSGESGTYQVEYDASEGIFEVQDGAIYRLRNGLFVSEIYLTEFYVAYSDMRSGAFENFELTFPLTYVLGKNFERMAYFFSHSEIQTTTSIVAGFPIVDSYYDYVRDENGNIINYKVELNDGANGIDQYWITYEQRPLN